MTLQERLAKARAAVTASGATPPSTVNRALGGGEPWSPGHAPGVLKGMAHHLKAAPSMYGRKSIQACLGIGDWSIENAVAKGLATPSINFGDKSLFPHIDPEFTAILLDLKKELSNAKIMQEIQVFQTKMPVHICETAYFKERVEPKLKAYDLAGFALWVPQINAGFFFQEFELEPAIDRYFDVYPMGSKAVLVPGTVGRHKAKLQGDADTFGAQYQTAGSYLLTAQDAVDHTDITEDLLQDMIPNPQTFDLLRKEVAMGIQRSKEDSILNGDDTITSSVQGDGHMDSDVAGGAATLFNKAFKGLRKRALAAGNTFENNGQGISLNTYNGLFAVLGKFAKDKADLLVVLGPTIANRVIMGGVPEILTMKDFGVNATLTTGILPRIFGTEQYESEWVREDLGAAGVYTAASTFSTVTVVKKSRFRIGSRAPMRVWATPSLANQDKLLLTAKERFSFGGIAQSAAEKSVACAIDVQTAS